MTPIRRPKRVTPLTDAELMRWQLYLRKNTRINTETGCWDWLLGVRRDGYGDSSTPRHHGLDGLAHRLAYQLFIGPIPDGLVVRHQCHRQACCNPAHLLVGTDQDNKDDDLRAGKPWAAAKLTEAQVVEVKQLLALGLFTKTQIARMLNMTDTSICNIANGKTWKHVTATPPTNEGN